MRQRHDPSSFCCNFRCCLSSNRVLPVLSWSLWQAESTPELTNSFHPFLVSRFSLVRSCTVIAYVMQMLPRTSASWSLVAVRAPLIVLRIEASQSGASSILTLLQRAAHWPTLRKTAGIITFQSIFLSRFGKALASVHCGTFPGGSSTVVNAFRNSIVGPKF